MLVRHGRAVVARRRPVELLRCGLQLGPPPHRRPHLPPARRLLSSSSSVYLHESTVPTMHYQDSLPRMPVPPLEETVQKYLAALEPIVTPEQHAEATEAATEFLAGPGPELHAALVARDAAHPHTSYINSWWFDMYVSDRRPLPINYNPQLLFQDDPRPEKQDAAARAADFIHNSVRFLRTLEAGKLTPECFHIKPKPAWFDAVMRLIPSGLKVPFRQDSVHSAVGFLVGAFPLDMSQFRHMFSTTRVPRRGKDEIVKAPAAAAGEPLRVLVLRGSGFHLVDATRPDGSPVPAAELQGALRQIADAPLPEQSPVAALTTMDRDDWADARDELLADNAEVLQAVDGALFAVTLEDVQPEDDVEMFRTMLYGAGRNRWFDKSFSFIFTPKGQVSMNFEHSWGDGVAVMRLCQELYHTSLADPVVADAPPAAAPQALQFNLSDSLAAKVAAAAAAFDAWTDTLHVCIAKTPKVTTAEAKTYKVAGDGLMQMAMQLAHYRMHGGLVSTYESANHAAFKHGRTETIRSATSEALAFVQAMEDGGVSQADKAAAMKAAIDNHGSITKDALMGQGIDRLLFGLRKMAEGEDGSGEVPRLFTTPAHAVWDKIIISTSTLSSPALVGGGFGPVNDDCYAFGYGLKADAAGFVTSSYREDLDDMGKALVTAVEDMMDLAKWNAEQKTSDGKKKN